MEIRAADMTGNDVCEAPVLLMLPEDEDIASITADCLYDTRRSYETIARRGAQPAISP